MVLVRLKLKIAVKYFEIRERDRERERLLYYTGQSEFPQFEYVNPLALRGRPGTY